MARRKRDHRELIMPPEISVTLSEPARTLPVAPPPPIGDPPLPVARPLPRATPLPRQQSARAARDVPTHSVPGPLPPPPPGSVVTPDNGQPSIDAPEADPLEPEDLAAAALKTAPAWLISFVLHTLILIVLSLIVIGNELPKIISLNVTYAETLGSQLDDDSLQAPVDLAGGESKLFAGPPADY
jgi:hypothetical protein